MSVVTNTILSYPIEEYCPELERLLEVNRFFAGSEGFVYCDDYGGTKMLETNIAIGAFNYLQLDELVKHLKGIKWEQPDGVQLIVQEQNDSRFRIINIFE